jgi:hypothetical protein
VIDDDGKKPYARVDQLDDGSVLVHKATSDTWPCGVCGRFDCNRPNTPDEDETLARLHRAEPTRFPAPRGRR